jgi:hypothetical protein
MGFNSGFKGLIQLLYRLRHRGNECDTVAICFEYVLWKAVWPISPTLAQETTMAQKYQWQISGFCSNAPPYHWRWRNTKKFSVRYSATALMFCTESSISFQQRSEFSFLGHDSRKRVISPLPKLCFCGRVAEEIEDIRVNSARFSGCLSVRPHV